jgi:aryl-alcohol dehydrogenase-like predicted oxidoreductase
MTDPAPCGTIEELRATCSRNSRRPTCSEVTMEYRTLGDSGVKVSPICLGTMLFGSYTDQAEAARIVGSAHDAGINFIDTAVSYAGGRGETILGDLLGSDRDWWIVATKVGSRTGDGPNEDGTSRRQIHLCVERSLRRLRTDRIDLYYLHRDDETTPLRESLQAVGDLIRDGKVLYLGLSNFSGWRVAEAVAVCGELGIPRPVALQPYYHALNRQPEVEVLPAAAHFGLGVVPYSPLARGVLTGKYKPGEAPQPGTRAGRNDFEIMTREWREGSLQIAQQIRERAEARGMTSGQFALNWVLGNALVTAVLAGPRTLEQWTEYLGALDHEFDAEDAAFVDHLVPPGHASTHGYTDPTYPVRGRVQRPPR